MEKMGKGWKQWKKKRRKLTSRDAFGYARHLKITGLVTLQIIKVENVLAL